MDTAERPGAVRRVKLRIYKEEEYGIWYIIITANPRVCNVAHTHRRKGSPTEYGGHSRSCGCLSSWREVAFAFAAWLPGESS